MLERITVSELAHNRDKVKTIFSLEEELELTRYGRTFGYLLSKKKYNEYQRMKMKERKKDRL